MKYEWKNIWKAGTLMLLGMLVVTVIGCVVLRMPGGVVTGLLDNNDINATQSWFVLSSFVATLILYVIMLLASTWGMLIFLGIRFYRSMYTGIFVPYSAGDSQPAVLKQDTGLRCLVSVHFDRHWYFSGGTGRLFDDRTFKYW